MTPDLLPGFVACDPGRTVSSFANATLQLVAFVSAFLFLHAPHHDLQGMFDSRNHLHPRVTKADPFCVIVYQSTKK
jgi:hypothetical protein